MKITQIYFILLLFTGSCTPGIFKGLDSSGKKRVEKSDFFPLVIDTLLMYNMQTQYKKTDLSGILLIKPIENHSIRILYTSALGFTIFDFELNETEFKVNRCLEQLQKKKVLKLYKKDFRTLFSYNLPEVVESKVYEKERIPVAYDVKTIDGKTFYLTEDNHLKTIEAPAMITSLKIEYQNYKDNLPENISITHPRLKLYMQLNQMK